MTLWTLSGDMHTLNHNERTHSLQRQIRRDGAGSRRGRRTEELIAQSGALALVTNLVMAWNTHQMQATLDRWRAKGREIDPQILHHITPMGFEGINFGASWSFPLTGTGRDYSRRARHRPPRWSRKEREARPFAIRITKDIGIGGILADKSLYSRRRDLDCGENAKVRA
jgi:hypothetical protein